MNRRHLAVLVFLLSGLPGWAEPAPVPTPSLGPRFVQTRERIDAIFKHRTGKVPNPETIVDLFRIPNAPANPTETPAEIKKPDPSESDEAVLQQALDSQRRNTLKRDGQLYLIINQKQYKEGDTVPAIVKGKSVSLLLKRVTANSVTFSYNQAEETVPF